MMGSGRYDISEELPLTINMKDKFMEIPRKSKTNILGSLVDDTGGTNVMVQAQIQKATGAFYRDAELLAALQKHRFHEEGEPLSQTCFASGFAWMWCLDLQTRYSHLVVRL